MTARIAQSTNLPSISIIVPANNVAPYLPTCIDSIRSQTFKNYELIIVDDGSTDETPSIIEQYVQRDRRITAFRQSQMGAGAARNNGMSHATGQFLLFFDGDDIMLPTMVQRLYERALETQGEIVVCHSVAFDDNQPGRILAEHKPCCDKPDAVRSGETFGNDLFRAFVGWPWDKLFDKRLIDRLSLKFQNLTSTNDAFFVFVALSLAQSIAIVPNTLVRHRMRAGSIETTGSATPHNVLKAYQAIEERLRQERVSEELMQSCHNWGLSHLRWAIDRFRDSDSGQQAAMEDYLNLANSFLPYPSDYFLFEADIRTHEMLSCAKEHSMEIAGLIQALDADKLRQENDALQNELSHIRGELERSNQAIHNIENSKSFRIGRMVTAAPRKARDVIAGAFQNTDTEKSREW